ncbi:DUF3907 family protein [Halalkalibacillus halophilus]|uniref:DUF3907 family protein n=1 Tax=Halalkalibacillus halophilus TaxID=392827 RepID=UPI001FE057C9|nr:DUF3907 family protein [Halalkalibacillus halophilus]
MNTPYSKQLESVLINLKSIEDRLNDFLNKECTQTILLSQPDLDKAYVESVFKQLRYIEVYSYEGVTAISKALNQNQLSNLSAEKILIGVNRKCIAEYYYPNNDLWFEDSRAAYASKSSIDFQVNPGREVIILMEDLEPHFQELREELEYLEAEN